MKRGGTSSIFGVPSFSRILTLVGQVSLTMQWIGARQCVRFTTLTFVAYCNSDLEVCSAHALCTAMAKSFAGLLALSLIFLVVVESNHDARRIVPALVVSTEMYEFQVDYASYKLGESIDFQYRVPAAVVQEGIQRISVQLKDAHLHQTVFDEQTITFSSLESRLSEYGTPVFDGKLTFSAPSVGTTVQFGVFDRSNGGADPAVTVGNIVVGQHVRQKKERTAQPGEKPLDCLNVYEFQITEASRKSGSFEHHHMAGRVLKECGMVVLHDLLDSALVSSLKMYMMSYLCAYQDSAQVTLALNCSHFTNERGEAHALPQWDGSMIPVMSVNHEKRFEFVVPFEKAFSDPAVWGNSMVMSVLERVSGVPRFILESTGGFNALPGATDQIWHIDSPHSLFKNIPSHPPYCSTLSIPLVPCDELSGCTQFSFRSHHCNDVDFDGNRLPRCPNNVDVWPKVSAGSAIIYDPRITHRGRANVGGLDRPMIHTSYCHSWYRDSNNGRGDEWLIKNIQKLGKPSVAASRAFYRNTALAESVDLEDLLHKMYALYAFDENEPLPVTEAFQGTSTGEELRKQHIAKSQRRYPAMKVTDL